MNKISVIIPSYNSSLTIGQTIEALLSQSKQDIICEIIIVDSSDDIKTKEIALRYKSDKIKIIDSGNKVMPAISRNMGAGKAKGEVLAFIDSDAYPAVDWAQNIIEAHKNGYKIGGGSVILPAFQKNKLIPLAQYYLQFNEYMDVGNIREKHFVPACNLFCEKYLFNIIGGFPEIRAAEDVLFCLKAGKIEKVFFIPEVKVYHIFREKIKNYFNNQFLLGKYVIIYRSMYYDSVIYKGISPLLLLPCFIIVKFCRIIIRVAQAGWGNIINFIIILPLFLSGLLFWGAGFARGCFGKE